VTKAEFLSDSDLLLEKALKTLAAKAAYSSNEDALTAFKEDAALAALLGIDATMPTHRCLIEILKKVRRLIRLEKEGWPKGTDGSEDSTLDIINYALLHHALVKEACDGKKNSAG